MAPESDKNVIVEIPAATAIDDGERLLGLAERAARRVFVCHTMRSFSGVRELRDRVKRDALDIRPNFQRPAGTFEHETG